MNSKKRPYLSYYEERGIIPVGQDISDLGAHFRRRSALYRHLGIIPSLLKGKVILEIGPGTGDNAIYTASLKPSQYVMIDGNSKSVDEINNKISEGTLSGNIEVHFENIDSYKDDRKFDLVICEGLLPGQANPEEFLRLIASFADQESTIIITTISAISTFPEVCRRIMKPFLPSVTSNFDEAVDRAVQWFGPHLTTLPGMSRYPRDWVMDNILHPWNPEITFSIPDAIAAIGDEFDVHGSSPRFMTDWRWYKSINEPDSGFNALAVAEYESCAAAFLDYRCHVDDAVGVDVSALNDLCQKAYSLHIKIWEEDDRAGGLSEFLGLTEVIRDTIKDTLKQTAVALDDYMRVMRRMQHTPGDPDFNEFKGLFGRGQQYLSFTRKV